MSGPNVDPYDWVAARVDAAAARWWGRVRRWFARRFGPAPTQANPLTFVSQDSRPMKIQPKLAPGARVRLTYVLSPKDGPSPPPVTVEATADTAIDVPEGATVIHSNVAIDSLGNEGLPSDVVHFVPGGKSAPLAFVETA